MTGPHVAVVLAAGGSTRLGRPKQLLLRADEPLVHRAARLAAATAPRRLFVVLGADSAAVAQALHGLPATRVDNPHWQAGLATSLQCVAPHLLGHAGPVLVIGCDQPALEVEHLHALLEGAQASPSGCAACLHDGLPGIPAVVPGGWFDGDGNLATSGDRGFGARLRALPAASRFDLDVPGLALDVDTPHDLDTAVARGWLDPPRA